VRACGRRKSRGPGGWGTCSANELINRVLATYPEDLVIATKVDPRRSRRWSACRTVRRRLPAGHAGRARPFLQGAGRRVRAVLRDRRRRMWGWRPARPERRGPHPSPGHAALPQRRCASPGRCIEDLTCWPSPVPVIRITWPRTWPRNSALVPGGGVSARLCPRPLGNELALHRRAVSLWYALLTGEVLRVRPPVHAAHRHDETHPVDRGYHPAAPHLRQRYAGSKSVRLWSPSAPVDENAARSA